MRGRLAFGLLVALGCGDSGGAAPVGDGGGSSSGGSMTSAGPAASGTDAATGDSGGSSDGGTGFPGCAVGHACLPTAPPMWTGPLALYSGPGGTVPSCQVGLANVLAGGLEISADPVACTCACAEPVGFTCEVAQLQAYGAGACGDASVPVSVGTGACQSGSWDSLEPSASLAEHPAASGSCQVEPDVRAPEPTWTTEFVGCAGPELPDAGCSSGDACLPLPAGGGYQICIYREGDHSCPIPYGVPRVGFAGFDDQRTCTGCQCGPLTDGMCSPSVDVFSAPGCDPGDLVHTFAVGDDACFDGAAMSVSSDPVATGTCTPSGTPEPSGEVQPTPLITICCG